MAAHADAEANPLYPVPVLWDRTALEHMYRVVASGRFADEPGTCQTNPSPLTCQTNPSPLTSPSVDEEALA